MPKHTTQDPGQKAFDIAKGEADKRWRQTFFDESFDYYAEVIENTNIYFQEFASLPTEVE